MIDMGGGATPVGEREHTSPESWGWVPQPPASNPLTGAQHNDGFTSSFLLFSCVCRNILHACESMYVGMGMHIYVCACGGPGVNVSSHPGLLFLFLTETRPCNQTQSSLMGLVSLVSLPLETLDSFGGWNYSPPLHI